MLDMHLYRTIRVIVWEAIPNYSRSHLLFIGSVKTNVRYVEVVVYFPI